MRILTNPSGHKRFPAISHLVIKSETKNSSGSKFLQGVELMASHGGPLLDASKMRSNGCNALDSCGRIYVKALRISSMRSLVDVIVVREIIYHESVERFSDARQARSLPIFDHPDRIPEPFQLLCSHNDNVAGRGLFLGATADHHAWLADCHRIIEEDRFRLGVPVLGVIPSSPLALRESSLE